MIYEVYTVSIEDKSTCASYNATANSMYTPLHDPVFVQPLFVASFIVLGKLLNLWKVTKKTLENIFDRFIYN